MQDTHKEKTYDSIFPVSAQQLLMCIPAVRTSARAILLSCNANSLSTQRCSSVSRCTDGVGEMP